MTNPTLLKEISGIVKITPNCVAKSCVRNLQKPICEGQWVQPGVIIDRDIKAVILVPPNERMAVMSRDEEVDEERWIRYGSAPLMATLLLPIIIGVIILLKCVFHHCCVRKTTSKDEMYGVEGRMTMLATADSNFATTLLPSNGGGIIAGPSTNQSPSLASAELEGIALDVIEHSRDRGNAREENLKEVAKLTSAAGASSSSNAADPNKIASFFDDGVQKRFSGSGHTQLKLAPTLSDSSELSGTLKRAAAQHRQLPDLPPTPHGVSRISQPPRRSSSVLSNDGTSELYATVGLVNGGSGDQPAASSIPSRARGTEATPSSDSETYAGSSSHHPYAKLKKSATEHPYARVRVNPSSVNNNDEETDTDNYDLPQFLNNPNPRLGSAAGNIQSPSSSSSSANRPVPVPNASQNADGIGPRNSVDAEGPVPPRRVGREWRRPGPSQQQINMNDMASHFSGDSQDSRGYTSISVREPLSNIRNEVTATGRSFDSHYATVSDDSEEMYAAIDDPTDANYMRIGDRQRDNSQGSRPAWIGGPIVSSPIPERREANSPLPPVPNVPPPDLSPGPSTSTVPPPLSPHSQVHSHSTPPTSTLPVYAQVSKKSKKQPQKAPLTTTLSNTSTTSSQHTVREVTTGTIPDPAPLREPSGTTSHHHSHHRSKRAASLMDNSNMMAADSLDTRRWSKADISYSEFEVVRENVFLTSSVPGDGQRSSPGSCASDVCDSASISRQQELLDEDNYNIIPDKGSAARNSKRPTPTSPSTNVQTELDSGNYHEIEPKNINNTYQEIGCGKEPSDHYQEIGRDGSELYQEIDRKDRITDYEDDDEDEEDQFYEKVKKPGGAAKKKHGYEKIKKKGTAGTPTEASTSHRFPTEHVDDDDDDDKPDEMYECVKYPPYERLKEMEDEMDSEDGKGSNYYEDIGYTRVKHKQKSKNTSSSTSKQSDVVGENSDVGPSGHIPVQDVHQLYAQIDKTKKRKSSSSKATSSNIISNAIKVEDIRVNNNEPTFSGSNEESYAISKAMTMNSSKSTINKNTESNYSDGAVIDVQNRLSNDNSIEYI